MATRRWQLGAFVASAWVVGVTSGNAVERMVGLVPTDGVAMFVKAFHVDAGTTISGVQFVNNDPAIVFPAVVLVVGAEGCLAGGTTVAAAANVQEASGRVVTVVWPAPVVVAQPATYSVGVCPPAGRGKQGPGRGAAVGADPVAAPNGSYIACGSSREFVPVAVDLAITLLTSSDAGLAKVGALIPRGPTSVRTFLAVRGGAGSPVTIEFGLGAASQDVSVRVYDVAGRLVRDVAQGAFGAGTYSRDWDGRNRAGRAVGTGVYLVRLDTGHNVVRQKIVLKD